MVQVLSYHTLGNDIIKTLILLIITIITIVLKVAIFNI